MVIIKNPNVTLRGRIVALLLDGMVARASILRVG